MALIATYTGCIEIQVYKNVFKITIFFFFQKYKSFYTSIPEECGLHKIFQC